jgi:Zn-dependent protease
LLPFKLRIHRSFFQLFIVLALLVAFQGRGAEGVAQFATGFGLLFFAVILHESSHAFVARWLGVSVRDIVVHPLGGMTRLDWSARDPRKEALISSAGPAINLLVAGLLWIGFRGALGNESRWTTWVLVPFLMINVALGALNLVPAFPMDGGRILRAVLATRLGHLPATRVAARIGRWLAILTLFAPLLAPSFGWSFWQSLAFPIVGLFVFILGEWELKQAEAAEMFARMGAAVRDAQERAAGPPGARPDAAPPGVIDVQGTSRVLEEEKK